MNSTIGIAHNKYIYSMMQNNFNPKEHKVAVIATHISNIFNRSEEYVKALLSKKNNFHSRILLTLRDYLTKHSKKFHGVLFIVSDEASRVYRNGTITGIMGMVNRSEIDIGAQFIVMNEVTTDIEDFAYPFSLESTTFVTRKAEYKPQIFDILQTFSLPLWIAIISTLIAMSLVYYVTFRERYSFDEILLHIFAVLLRQSSVLKPSSMIKRFLVFSWDVGAMFLCLAYSSVILSFLSFPPVFQVKDVPQLAKAVKEGYYHCVASRDTTVPKRLFESEDENLKLIGLDILTNNLSYENIRKDFYYDRNKPNIALLRSTLDLDIYTVGQKFVSQDRFIEAIVSMPIRKDFCCKKFIDNFVHRMMASGLYFKYKNDRAFLRRLPRLMKHKETDTSKRVLTLTDVAPAFIFLIFGYIISFLALIVEIVGNRMKKKCKKTNEYRMRRRF